MTQTEIWAYMYSWKVGLLENASVFSIVCPSFPSFVRLFHRLSVFSIVCPSFPSFVRLFHRLSVFSIVCPSFPSFVRLFHRCPSFPSFVRLFHRCPSFPSFVRCPASVVRRPCPRFPIDQIRLMCCLLCVVGVRKWPLDKCVHLDTFYWHLWIMWYGLRGGRSKNGRCCEGGGQFCWPLWINVSAARERMFIYIYTKVSVLKVRMNVEIKLSATTIKVKDT